MNRLNEIVIAGDQFLSWFFGREDVQNYANKNRIPHGTRPPQISLIERGS